ncbi:hypothetical protein NDN08_004264 [Rhodosorus marinus]|uniref:Peptidase S54 rhomboid domain-containing protein n=1 Tax=Rhodosorus marinus TaxID=101924 RepID=A0AAV8UKY8_9RHOD|nr:hypothetical protein NDN08_004264 [Rhodosorus marinus]
MAPAFCAGLGSLRRSGFFKSRAKASICTRKPQIHGRMARKRGQMQMSQMLIGLALNSIIGTLKKASDSNEGDRTTKAEKLKRRIQNREWATPLIILINLVVYIMDKLLHIPAMSSLTLRVKGFHSWQLVTSLFCHNDWHHLSSNLFLLFFFGRLVEEEHGGIVFTLMYLFCGVMSNLACVYFAAKNAVFLGSSGAIYGLFVISVLTRFRLSWKRLVEFCVIGNFVASTTFAEVGAMNTSMGRKLGSASAAKYIQVNHFGHLAGAAAGLLLLFLVRAVLGKKK